MRIFGLKNCDTCRKALKTLRDAGQAVEFVDVRVDGIGRVDLMRFYATFGDRLLNTRSTTWRGLSEADRQCDPLDLLAQHPALMKRPVIETGEHLTLGWDTQTASTWQDMMQDERGESRSLA